jgi:PAS domain S-box-containing protein
MRSDVRNSLHDWWGQARRRLGESLRVSGDQSDQHHEALEKANAELKAAQAEFQRRWRLLAEAQRLSHAGTFAWNVRTGELTWSDETFRILGVDREATPTLDLFFSRVHAGDLERVRRLADLATETGIDLDFEHRIILPDGLLRHVHTVAHADHSGTDVLEYVGVVTDITERKRADEERQSLSSDLQESNAKLEEAQRVAHVGYWEWNLDTNDNFWSDETFRIYGLEPQKGPIDISAISEMIHPDDRESVFRTAESAVRGGTRPDAEHRIIRPSGEVRTVYSQGDVKRDASGRPIKMFGTVQDVTDRKRAEATLQQIQRYLSAGERLAHMGSWASTNLGIRWSNDLGLYWSDEIYSIFGMEPKEGPPTLERYLAAYHSQDRAAMAETIKKMHEERCGCDITKRIVRPNGEVRYVRCVGVPVFEGGVFKAIHGTTMDVTEHELLTQELRREKAYLAEAQSLTRTGSWAANLLTREIFHSSDENARLYGFDPGGDPLSFDRFYSRILPEDESAIRVKLEEAIRSGEDYDVEFRISRADGAIRVLRGIGHRNPSQPIGEYFGITIDVTDRKHAEIERQRLQQLESELARVNRANMMGELAAALAHEIKQPITASVTSANALLRWLAHDPPDLERARTIAARIEQNSNRAANVIDSLRSFYQTGTPAERHLLDVSEIVEEITVLLTGEADRHAITIHSALAGKAPRILANRVQLQQVFMNLMLNAIEAMKDTGGKLTVRSELSTEGHLLVAISDTGIGLPTESTERIFEPFHTTKPHGTGMGLAITRSILESYGGRVWASANESAGATFYFTLPCEGEDH